MLVGLRNCLLKDIDRNPRARGSDDFQYPRARVGTGRNLIGSSRFDEINLDSYEIISEACNVGVQNERVPAVCARRGKFQELK